MSKTRQKRLTKPTLSTELRGLSIEAAKAVSKSERQKLICDAFVEMHHGIVSPTVGKIGKALEDTTTFTASDVASWAIRNALYPVPGSDATQEHHAAWADKFQQAMEQTVLLSEQQRLDDIEENRLKLD